MSYEVYYDRYKELCDMYKIKHGTHDLIPQEVFNLHQVSYTEKSKALAEAMEPYDVVVEWAGGGYAHKKYRVLRNVPKLCLKDLAIICDKGNLCFGYRTDGTYIIVHTD